MGLFLMPDTELGNVYIGSPLPVDGNSRLPQLISMIHGPPFTIYRRPYTLIAVSVGRLDQKRCAGVRMRAFLLRAGVGRFL